MSSLDDMRSNMSSVIVELNAQLSLMMEKENQLKKLLREAIKPTESMYPPLQLFVRFIYFS